MTLHKVKQTPIQSTMKLLYPFLPFFAAFGLNFSGIIHSLAEWLDVNKGSLQGLSFLVSIILSCLVYYRQSKSKNNHE